MYSVLLAEIVAQNSLTFLSFEKPLIFIILSDFFSDSFQLNAAIRLYFTAPPVSSTKRLIFKGAIINFSNIIYQCY